MMKIPRSQLHIIPVLTLHLPLFCDANTGNRPTGKPTYFLISFEAVERLEQYITIQTTSEGSYSELSSKFLAFAFPVSSEEEAISCKMQLRKSHHKAAHIAYAYRLGYDTPAEKSSDDGEPSGSSGLPILNVLRSLQITNAAVFVVRYYGGKKLGIPGLIRAYKTATENAIANNTLATKDVLYRYSVSVADQYFNNLMHALNQMGAVISEIDYGTQCKMRIHIRGEQLEKLEELISKFWQAEFILLAI